MINSRIYKYSILMITLLLGVSAVNMYLKASQIYLRHFPRLDLPAETELVDPPGVPIEGLDIQPGIVLGMYINNDDEPDLLVASENGGVRALINVFQDSNADEYFKSGDFSENLNGKIIDILVADLDNSGSHDLVILKEKHGKPKREEVEARVVAVSQSEITVPGQLFSEHELIGMSIQPDRDRAEKYVVADNTPTTIVLDGVSDHRTLTAFDKTLIVERQIEAGKEIVVQAFYNSGDGAFTESKCMPQLVFSENQTATGLGALDADQDGKLDIVIETSEYLEGRASEVTSEVIDTNDFVELKHFTIADYTAAFPSFQNGMKVIADINEGKEYPVTELSGSWLSFEVVGPDTMAGAGSKYRLINPSSGNQILRGLGQKCFAPASPNYRFIYSLKYENGSTVILDPEANLMPSDGYKDLQVRFSGEVSTAAIIKSHTAGEIILTSEAGDLTSQLVGITDGGKPNKYAIIPKTMPAVEPTDYLPNERSSISLPFERTAYRPLNKTGLLSAAVADVNQDGNPDVVIASNKLMLQLHR
jgi:hypothetical protein